MVLGLLCRTGLLAVCLGLTLIHPSGSHYTLNSFPQAAYTLRLGNNQVHAYYRSQTRTQCIVEYSKDNDMNVWQNFLEYGCSFYAVHVWHGEIHQNQIGLQLGRFAD